jgi:hypothetical protein
LIGFTWTIVLDHTETGLPNNMQTSANTTERTIFTLDIVESFIDIFANKQYKNSHFFAFYSINTTFVEIYTISYGKSNK